MKRIKASRAGGSWKDWNANLIADCHRRETGESYPGVYGRMSWDEPSPTMTTQFYGFGSGRFGHPEQDRALSLREGAILQTFPDDYEFVPPGKAIKKTTVGRLIGNAVPVRLGEVIGKSIMEHVWSLGNKARRVS
jgi:DNA (cytosine-5)-methyltransferase 1